MMFRRLVRLAGPFAASLLLAACAASDSQVPGGIGQTGPFEPTPVRGVEPCTDLSINDGQVPEEDQGLPVLDLPCLTEPGRVDAASLGGRPTLVNLWASWCGPCRKEMPILQTAYEQVAGEIQFVGIDTRDSPQGAAEFLAQVKVTYPQLVDADGALLADTRVPGLPVTLLLDEFGNEINRHIGALTAEDLTELLAEASTGSGNDR